MSLYLRENNQCTCETYVEPFNLLTNTEIFTATSVTKVTSGSVKLQKGDIAARKKEDVFWFRCGICCRGSFCVEIIAVHGWFLLSGMGKQNIHAKQIKPTCMLNPILFFICLDENRHLDKIKGVF